MSEAPAPYSLRFVRSTAFGVLAAVELPSGVAPVPNEVLSRLHPAEQPMVAVERGRRQVELAGGRLAFGHALAHLGRPRCPLLTHERGAPHASGELTVSISHKTDLALALVADAADGTVGLDLEGGGREPLIIAPKVLRPEELEAFNALPEAQRWPSLLLRFAVKEATYKAIFPHLRRFVSFQEARVHEGPLGVELLLKAGEPPLRLEVATELLGARLLAFVRARPAG